MTNLALVLILVVVALCALALTLVPAILALKRTAESLTALSDMLQQELKPAIQEMTELLSELKSISRGISEHSGDVARFMSALGETGSSLHSINRTVGSAAGMLNVTSAWVTGAKVAGKYIIERYLKKRGGN